MKRISFLTSLLLLATLSAQGFSVPSLLSRSNQGPPSIASSSTVDISQEKTSELQAQAIGKDLEASQPGNNAVSQFLRQQSVVFRTSLVVAATAAVTRHLPRQGLRGDMLTGTLIFMVGDWGAQLLTHWKTNRNNQNNNINGRNLLSTFNLDNNRFVISTLLGAIWAGICNPAVYAGVEYMLPGVSVKLVLVKMAITCSILSTAGNYVTMMFRRFIKQVWEAKTTSFWQVFRACAQSCNRDFMEVLKDDLKIFPLYDILCYSVIPPRVRPLTNALIASAWAMYMSIASAKTTTTTTNDHKNVEHVQTTAVVEDQSSKIEPDDAKLLVEKPEL